MDMNMLTVVQAVWAASVTVFSGDSAMAVAVKPITRMRHKAKAISLEMFFMGTLPFFFITKTQITSLIYELSDTKRNDRPQHLLVRGIPLYSRAYNTCIADGMGSPEADRLGLEYPLAGQWLLFFLR